MSDYVYLDHAASAPTRYFAKDYYIPGNPNSSHVMGLQANQALNEARQRIMDSLNLKSGKLIIGGSASQLINELMKKIYEPCYVSPYEHECVNKWGCDIVDVQLSNIQKNDVVCWMMTNNITGDNFPVETIGKKCRQKGAFYIMDAVASMGHCLFPKNIDSFCDCLFVSGHKFNAEKNLGFIWISDRFSKFLDISNDSYEEYGLISGTPNVPGAIALSFATKKTINSTPRNQGNYYRLTKYLMASLNDLHITAKLIGNLNTKSYAINALYLPGFNSDALTNFLSSQGIYISPGHSACSNNTNGATRVLEAFGLTKEQASQTIRISFDNSTSQKDIDALVNGIVEFRNLFL